MKFGGCGGNFEFLQVGGGGLQIARLHVAVDQGRLAVVQEVERRARVEGLGFRVWGLWCRVWGSGFRVQRLGLRVEG